MMDYNVVTELVIQASNYIFDEKLKKTVSMKGEADFLTAVDLSISNFLKAKLFEIAPQVSFMSEEEENGYSDNRWILDPIDGTTNLVYGYPMSSVSLAYMEKNEVIFGVVYNPYTKELFTAEKGKGANLNGKPIPVVLNRELKDCLIEFGAGSTNKHYAELSFSIAKKAFLNCLDLRRVCSTALAICYVAAGRLNGYFEWKIKPWDYAAAALILEECGGISTDWEGHRLQYDHSTSFICGTQKAYEFISKIITEEIKNHKQ